MLLKRYGDYVTLAGLAGFIAIVYVAIAHGFNVVLVLLVFYAVIVTAAGLAMRAVGKEQSP